MKSKGFILIPIKMNDAKAYLESHKDEESIKGFISTQKRLLKQKKKYERESWHTK